jgi:hypothetical protein
MFGFMSILSMSRGPNSGFKNMPNGECPCWVPRRDRGNDGDRIDQQLQTLVGAIRLDPNNPESRSTPARCAEGFRPIALRASVRRAVGIVTEADILAGVTSP